MFPTNKATTGRKTGISKQWMAQTIANPAHTISKREHLLHSGESQCLAIDVYFAILLQFCQGFFVEKSTFWIYYGFLFFELSCDELEEVFSDDSLWCFLKEMGCFIVKEHG